MLRNKIRYLMLLAIVGLLLILFNQYYIGMIFLTIIMMPFFLFGLLSYIYGRIRAELVFVVHVAGKGDKIPITVQLNNPTVFPIPFLKINLSFKNSYSDQKFRKTICTSLDNNTKASVTLHLSSAYAGNMEIILESIHVYDYMKIFSLKRKLFSRINVAVLPSYNGLELNEIIDKNMFLEDSDTYSSVRKGDDPSEVFEIRNYREGDRLPRVHWKLSIKQQQLMIKEFSDPVTSRELLFVNLNVEDKDRILIDMNLILECTLSFSYSLIQREHPHYLAWYDTEQGACRRVRISREQELYEAVDGLLHAKPYFHEVDALTVYSSEYPQEHYCELYYISSVTSVPKVDSFLSVKVHNRQILYVQNEMEGLAESEGKVALMSTYVNAGIEVWQMHVGDVEIGMEQFSLV